MASLTPYNQLQIVTPEPLANGGQALNNNFKALSTKMTPSDPLVTSDSNSGYAQGSIWYNASTFTVFICVDASVGAAVWNPLPTAISFANSETSGLVTALVISPTYNQTSGTAANTDLLINRTENNIGSGAQRLIDAQVGGTSIFQVDPGGNIYATGNVAIGYNATANSINSIAVGIYATASGYFSSASGYQCTASGYYATARGSNCAASSTHSTASGLHCTASGQFSTARGRYSVAGSRFASASGYYALAKKTGVHTHANGRVSTAGDKQRSVALLSALTTDGTTAVILTLDGSAASTLSSESASNRYILATNKSYGCTITVHGKVQSSSTNAVMFKRTAIAVNNGGSTTVTVSSSTAEDIVNGTGISWNTPVIQADTTYNALQVSIVGVASTNISWQAIVEASELEY